MTLVKLIQIDSEPEPLSYHGAKSTDPRPFSVAFSPAAEGHDELAAKDHFQKVLAAASDIRWYTYHLDIQASSVTAKRVQAVGAPISAPSDPDAALQAHLMNWLEARAAVLESPFFVRPEAGKEVVEAGKASAGDTLRVAQGWDAPVPQMLGLMHLVEVPGFSPGQILVPFFSDNAPPDMITGVEVRKDLAQLEASLFGDDTTIKCQTNILRDPPSPASIYPIDPDTGFLTANSGAEDLSRALQTIEETGATQLWATPVLQEVVSNDGDPDLSNALATPGFLRWLAAVGAATALDPVIFALTMPGVEGSEGHLLARLINLALAKIADEVDKRPTTALPRLTAIDDIKLRAAFKAAIEATALFSSADDKVVVAELRRLHGLPPDKGTEAGTTDLTLLNAFLFDFQDGKIGPKDGDSDLPTITRALGDLTAHLEEEAGAEHAILAVLEPLFTHSDEGISSVQSKIDADWPVGYEEKEALVCALDETWVSFKRTLEGPFDGAEAVRRSVGHVLQDALIGAVSTPLSQAEFAAALNVQNYFSSRVLPVSKPGVHLGLRALAERLWRPTLIAPAPKWLTDTQVVQLTQALDSAFEALAEILMPTMPGVLSVDCSLNGQALASGGWDGTAKLWAIENGQEMQTFIGHADGVISVTFSPDGQTLASGSWDGTAKLWDVETGQELQTFIGHTSEVTSVTFSQDGQTLASGSWDGTAKLWAVETGQELQAFIGHTSGVTSVTFSSDGQMLASGSCDKTAKLWDTTTGQEKRTLTGHKGRVTSVAISLDGQTLASGSWDKTAKLWDTATGKELRTLSGHLGGVTGVVFSVDGQNLASVSSDKTAKLWEGATGQELLTFKGHAGGVTSVALSEDGHTLASGSWDGTAKLWNAVTGHELHTLTGHAETVTPEDLRLMKPDQAPKPLSIQIADDLDPKELEEFDQVFKGIGILVQRQFNETDTSTEWAHANLVKLIHDPNDPTKKKKPEEILPTYPISKVAVRPFFPALVDNRRTLFLDYNGFPMATPVFDETRARQDIPADEQGRNRELILRQPFHLADDITVSEFEGVPRLAYGAKFQIAAFAVTNGGTLPPLVANGKEPTFPKTPGNLNDELRMEYLGKEIYRRRTAIGRIALEIPDDYKAAKTAIKEIQPLSADYPRQSLGCIGLDEATLDIFRNTDGQGAILLGADVSKKFVLRNLEWWGGKGTLTVEVWQMSRDDDTAAPCPSVVPYAVGYTGQLDYTPGRNAYGLEITVTSSGVLLKQWLKPKPLEATHDFADDLPPGPFWLRLTLQANNGSSSISFDDTLKAEDPGNFYARPEPAIRILMVPDKGIWSSEILRSQSLTLGFPRVGYLDFERWCANPKLPHPAGDDPEIKDAIDDALLVAYLVRGSTSQSAPHPDAERELSIAELLERLPDPAVHKLLVTLLPEDRLGPPSAHAKSIIIDVPTMPVAPDSFDSGDEVESEIEYRKYLQKIDDALKETIEISVGTFFNLKNEPGERPSATIPEGMVARFQVRPIVAATLCFDEETKKHPYYDRALQKYKYAPIDAGITARVIGKVNHEGATYLIFPGPDMVVETLTDYLKECEGAPWSKISKMVLCDPSGLDRAYALRLATDYPHDMDVDLWRSLSHIDIATQQWRFSGRPIYNWPALPKQGPDEGPVKKLEDPSEEIIDFEKEAFFDRDNADAGQLTKRLEPVVPHVTVPDDYEGLELQRFVWDAPTATMFRHRFVLRSRYAAAMVKGGEGVREVYSWSKDKVSSSGEVDSVWTYRVVIRAALSRIEMNRPQLRALLPLMAPVGEVITSPPILAVLEEKPFVDGGLAERVLGMIHTGVHFGFPHPRPTDPNKWVVQPQDTRKEIGPNPRMALRPLDTETALAATFSHEGPIGLSFDADTAVAPAWVNSQHLFTPLRLGKTPGGLQDELHMGVSLIRVLDPSWCDLSPMENISVFSARRNWLMTFAPLPAENQVVLNIGNRPIFRTGGNIKRRTLQIWNRAIDAYADADVWSDLAEVDQSNEQTVSLLHQALGEGCFRATLLQAPKPADDSKKRKIAMNLGRDNTFRVLASIPWSIPNRPELITATVTGKILSLIYDETLDKNSTPAIECFTIGLGETGLPQSVTDVLIASTNATLTLDPGVVPGDTVTVNYTLPTNNSIQNVEGNVAGPLVCQPVTNNSADSKTPALINAMAAGKQLALVYDELLDNNSTPQKENFTIDVGGDEHQQSVKDVVIAGTSVMLTLSQGLGSGDMVAVNYTPPALNPIQDFEGHIANSIVGQPVANDNAEGFSLSTLMPIEGTLVLPAAASAPTDMRWIKTVGDNTTVEVAQPGQARSTVSMPLQKILAKRTARKTISFLEKEDGKVIAKLWPRGKIGIRNVPNATHRHLAAIFTRRLKGPGRAVEVFAGSVLMDGRKLSLGADKELINSIDTADKVSIRFLSFETPARPLAATQLGHKGIRPEYQKAYFDRVAVTNRSNPAEVRLKICLVRNDPENKRLREVTFRLSDTEETEYLLGTVKGDGPAQNGPFLDTINLTLRQQDESYASFAEPIFSDGTKGDEVTLGHAFSAAAIGEGFYLEFSVTPGRELWADASCLFSETEHIGFNFDWVFSPNVSDRNMETETQPDALNKMTEAQALVQMVSAPIPVKGIKIEL